MERLPGGGFSLSYHLKQCKDQTCDPAGVTAAAQCGDRNGDYEGTQVGYYQ